MNQDEKKSTTADVPPIHWKQARPQPRVRPQWDAVELAKKFLDDMERGGRLERSKRA